MAARPKARVGKNRLEGPKHGQTSAGEALAFPQLSRDQLWPQQRVAAAWLLLDLVTKSVQNFENQHVFQSNKR